MHFPGVPCISDAKDVYGKCVKYKASGRGQASFPAGTPLILTRFPKMKKVQTWAQLAEENEASLS